MSKIRLPVEFSSQLPPRLRTKINRWLQENLQQNGQAVTGDVLEFISQLGAELASELELHSTPGMILAVSPEAVDLLANLPAMLSSAGKAVPSEVTHLLKKLEKHRARQIAEVEDDRSHNDPGKSPRRV